jgi:hypothetical protein
MCLLLHHLRSLALSSLPPSSGLVKLVDRCLSWLPADRPSFREILHTLEHIYKEVRGKAAGEGGGVGSRAWLAWICCYMDSEVTVSMTCS